MAVVVKRLLKELGGSLDTVRPASVQKKWRIMSGESGASVGLLSFRPTSSATLRALPRRNVSSRDAKTAVPRATSSGRPFGTASAGNIGDSPMSWGWASGSMRPDTAATLNYDGPMSRQSSRGGSGWPAYARRATPLQDVKSM